jgi:DNA end-binding protein Ku
MKKKQMVGIGRVVDIPEMKLPDQMVGLAEEIIDRMSGEFEPDKFEDRYERQPNGCAEAQHRSRQ